MSSDDGLSIGEVVRLTGLTGRTLRFYEHKGLISPARSSGGRRVYGAVELARLHRICALRQAGFSLDAIRRMLSDRVVDAREIVAAQIADLEAQRATLDLALRALRTALEALEGAGVIDVDALCDTIRLGQEHAMEHDKWHEFYDSNFTPEEQERWRAAKRELAGAVDPPAYEAKWRDLLDRIQRALPLDAASAQAQSFLAEWDELLEPFAAHVDDDMLASASKAWRGGRDGVVGPPIAGDVLELMRGARRVASRSTE